MGQQRERSGGGTVGEDACSGGRVVMTRRRVTSFRPASWQVAIGDCGLGGSLRSDGRRHATIVQRRGTFGKHTPGIMKRPTGNPVQTI